MNINTRAGIRQYVEYLNKNKTPLHEEVVYVEGIEDGILAEIAMQYNDGYIPSIYSFCNNINTMKAERMRMASDSL